MLETVRYWSENPRFDRETRAEARRMLDDRFEQERKECFDGVLEFGTGGLRGIMGVGTNRMNRYTVMQTTEGLAKVIRMLEDGNSSGVVIGNDSRHNSKYFAQVSAEVLTAHDIPVFLFADEAPTPLVSCELLRRSATAAIVITASHNPPEYNGYKVYWSNGGQIIPPVDMEIVNQVKFIDQIDAIRTKDLDHARHQGLLRNCSSDADEHYLSLVEKLSLGQVEDNTHFPLVYSPLHGTGGRLVPELLRRRGFIKVKVVEEQGAPDGNFPTVISPNPEDPRAFELGIKTASDSDELILCNDPDADRLGVMVRDRSGNWQWLNGNQIGVLLLDHALNVLKSKNILPPSCAFITTVVTSPLTIKIARAANLDVIETLTGFKWIRDAALTYESSGKGKFLFGMEESNGYLMGNHTGDKDGVWAAMAFAEMAAALKVQGFTPLAKLAQLHEQYGFHLDALETLTFEGYRGTRRIETIMRELRENPPLKLGGLPVTKITDLLLDRVTHTGSQVSQAGPGLPASNVLILELENQSRVIARPSGTEPKIKYYFNLCGKENHLLQKRLSAIKTDLGFSTEVS